MNPISVQDTSSLKPSQKRSLWQRLREFQPSLRLVTIVFVWWVLLVITTALDMTSGFGITALKSVVNPLYDGCLILLAVLIVISVIDIVILRFISRVGNFQLSRKFPKNIPIYHPLNIEVLLTFFNPKTNKHSTNHNAKASVLLQRFIQWGFINKIRLDYYDDYPSQLTLLDTMPIATIMTLKKPNHQQDDAAVATNLNSSSLTIQYPVIPSERGTGYFGPGYVRVWSPLRLFRRSLVLTVQDAAIDTHEASQYLRVLADFSGLLSNQLAVIFEKSVHAGVQALLQQGQGSDFLDLKEYSVGDAIRQIDWKASSRLRRMMSKTYEDENDQDVVFLLDCSEQMRHQDIYENDSDIDDVLHTDAIKWQSGAEGKEMASQARYFDKVLNAVLLLSYIANKQSDRVGLMTFGGVDVFLPPQKGSHLIRHLLEQTADIKPTLQTADYLVAAQDLMKNLKKRSVVILITNTRAEATDELSQAVSLLSKRHKVVFANLMEQVIFDRIEGDMMPKSMDDALLYHALVDYQHSRHQLKKRINQQTGAFCLQTTANHLPGVLTKAYLTVSKH